MDGSDSSSKMNSCEGSESSERSESKKISNSSFAPTLERLAANIFRLNETTTARQEPRAAEVKYPEPGLFLKQFKISVNPLLESAHKAFRKHYVEAALKQASVSYDRRASMMSLKRKIDQLTDDGDTAGVARTGDTTSTAAEKPAAGEAATATGDNTLAGYLDGVYCDFSLTIVQKNFLQFVTSIFGERLAPAQRLHLERIVVNNFNNFFLLFLYLIYNTTASHRIEFNYQQQKRIRTIPIKDNSVEHYSRQVHFTTAAYCLDINFLLPPEKEKPE